MDVRGDGFDVLVADARTTFRRHGNAALRLFFRDAFGNLRSDLLDRSLAVDPLRIDQAGSDQTLAFAAMAGVAVTSAVEHGVPPGNHGRRDGPCAGGLAMDGDCNGQKSRRKKDGTSKHFGSRGSVRF